MKKILQKIRMLLMVLAVVLMSWSLRAQVTIPYTMDFEDQTAFSAWTMSNCASGTGLNSSAAHAGSYGFEFYYTTNYPQYLISPQFVASTNPLQVEFYYTNNSTYYAETFHVGYSTTTNDVTAFTWGPEISVSNGGIWLQYTGTIPAGAKYIAIKCTSDDQYYLYIDDITIANPPTCIAPSTPQVSNLTPNSADITWTSNGTETAWEISVNNVSDYASTTTHSLSNLTAETQYTVKVRAICTPGDTSAWSQPVTFTTLASCAVPTHLTLTNLSSTSADIAWVAGFQETEWEVLVNNVPESAYDTALTLNNLTPETNYTVKVRAVCGVGDTSAWTSALNFYTGYCRPNPYSVDNNGITNVTFGNAPEVVNNSPANSGSITYGNFYTQVGAVPAGTAANVDITYATEYTYGTLIWVDWNHNLMFEDSEIVYMGTSTSNSPTTLNASFTVPATQDTGLYRMRIGGSDSYFDSYISGSTTAAHDPCYDGYYTVYHDYTLHVTEVPDCLPVYNLTMDSATATSVFLSWSDANNGSAVFHIYNMADTTIVASSISALTYEVTGLTANTAYKFGVAADCYTGHETTLATVNARTDCAILTTLPYTCGFEANEIPASETYSMPYCWSKYNDGTSSNYYPYSNSANGRTGRSLYFYTNTYSDYADTMMAVLPQVDVTAYPMSGNQLSFWMRTASDSYTYDVLVGTLSDPTDPSTFVVERTIAVTGTTYNRYDVNLTNAPSTNSYAAIMVPRAANSGSIYIDDVVLQTIPTCPTPLDFVCTGTTSNSASLSWRETGSAQAWEVAYGPVGFNPNDATATFNTENATDTFVTVNNLTGGTLYHFYVRANCTSSDNSAWEGPVAAAPGSYNMHVSGWDTLYSCGAVIYDDGGANGVYSNNCASYLVIYPDQPGNMVSVSGTLTAESSSWDYLIIYDGDNTTTQLFKTNQSSNTLFQIPAITSTTGPLTIYFKSDGSGQYAGFELVTTCVSCVAPTLTASHVLIDEATVSWNSFTGLQTNFEIAYGPTGFNPNSVQAESATGFSHTITGLSPNTAYDVYIRTDCDNGTYSLWSSVLHFTTLPPCPAPTNLAITALSSTSAEISWVPGYQETEWEVMVGNISGSAYDTTYTLSNLTPETNYTVKVRAVCGSGETSAWSSTLNIYTGYCQPNPSSVDDNGITNVTFGNAPEVVNNTPANSGSIYYGNFVSQVGAVPAGTVANVSITYATGYTYGTLIWMDWNSNLTFEENEIVYMGTSSSANPTTLNASFMVPATLDTGLYRMRIGGADSYFDDFINGNTTAAHDPCASSSWMVFHDYTMHVTEAPNCLPVMNLAIGATTDNSITLTWSDPLNSGASYTIYNMADSSVVASGLTDTSYTITTLTSNTAYTFAVETDCGGGDLSAMLMVSGRTDCGQVSIPYTENFETETSDVAPLCWTVFGGSPRTYNSSSNAHGGSQYLHFSGAYSNMIAFPSFVQELNTLQVRFWTRPESFSSSYCGSFSVGYMSNIADSSTFVAVATYSYSDFSAYEEKTVIMSSAPNGARLAFRHNANSTYYYWYVDDVVVENIPSCPGVSNVTFDAVTSNSVTLSWTEQGSATDWNVEYGPSGFALGQGTSVAVSTTPTTTIQNLTSGTAYDFYVQAACNPADMSTWVGPVSAVPGSYNIPTSGTLTVSMCGGAIYDDGGVNGDYSSNANVTVTVNPDVPGQMVQLSGSYDLEAGYDYLIIYDGADNTGTELFRSSSSYSDPDQGTITAVTSTTGPLTIYFYSDFSTVNSGFVLQVNCVTGGTPQPDTCLAPSNLTATNVTSNSVVLDWTENGTATSWTVNYKEVNAANWSTTTASSKPYTLIGLQPETAYSAYVVANCTSGQSGATNTVTFTTESTGIADYELATTLYPNPNNGQFTIHNEQFTINNVNVYDVYGKLLKTVEVNSNTAVIDAQELSAGMYFVRISTEKGVVTKSFVKK